MESKMICRVLTGPTASGKSDLAMRLAMNNNWDIICMDSMQVYRRMDIGTAKPSAEDRRKVRHYMLDICEPTGSFSVSAYIEQAEKKVREIASEGREALFVGGTGLYLEGLVKPMGMGFVPANEALRTELRQLAEQPEGRRLLDERLRKCDPETAEKLPLNDLRRRIRAIEVSEATGTPFSKQPESSAKSPFEWRIVCTAPERETLYTRINERVQRMIDEGLAGEVSRLIAEGVPENAQSMQAIGYKEMIPFLHGEYPLGTAADLIRKGTRHYAKRQMTFLKRLEQVRFTDPFSDNAYGTIENILKGNMTENE